MDCLLLATSKKDKDCVVNCCTFPIALNWGFVCVLGPIRRAREVPSQLGSGRKDGRGKREDYQSHTKGSEHQSWTCNGDVKREAETKAHSGHVTKSKCKMSSVKQFSLKDKLITLYLIYYRRHFRDFLYIYSSMFPHMQYCQCALAGRASLYLIFFTLKNERLIECKSACNEIST